MITSISRLRRASIGACFALMPMLASAVPVAVNDTFTATEDTTLTVSGTGTTNLLTADFEPGANQADGFTLVKNAFGTTADTASTTFMSGALVTSDKHGGTSSYYVDCGRDFGTLSISPPKSVGIQTTITLGAAGTVRIGYWYRMQTVNMEWGGGNPTQYEAGDQLFKVDSTYYGTAYTETLPNPDVSNTAILHQRGFNTGGVNGTVNSGWLQVTQDVPLIAGTHTITLGTYCSSTNNSNEHVEAWIDDVTVDLLNAGGGVLLNDTGGATSASLVTNVAHGTLTLNPAGSFTYAPTANYFGPDSFTYQASDGVDLSNVATVTINVTGVNDIPVAVANSYNLNEDTPLTTTLANGVLLNDTDADGDVLTAILNVNVTRGSLVLNSNGTFTYTPTLNYNGADSFTYHANDGSANSNIVTVTLTIAAVNDPPVGGADAYTTTKNTALVISAPGGSNVTETIIAGAIRGPLTANAFAITTPGSVWKYWDQGTTPVATWATSLTASETGWLSGTSELGYGDEADSPSWPQSTNISFGGDTSNKYTTSYFRKIVNLTDVAHITALNLQVMRDDGIILYFNGTPAYRCNLISSPLAATFANNTNVEHDWNDASLLGTDGTPDSGNWLAAAPTSALFVEGNNLFAAEVHQSTLSSSDISFDVDLSITRTVNFGLLFNDSDPEGQTMTAQVATQPTHGTVVINANGTFTYTPTTGYSGPDTFTYQAKDASNALSTPVTVTLTVVNTTGNSPPVTVADSYNATEDTTLNVPAATGVLANDTDPDADLFTAVILAQATKGTVTLNSDGSFSYVPNLNANGTDTFTYRANDGAYSQPATVTITIAAVNDAPVATNESYGGDPGATMTISAAAGVLVNDTDVDGNALTAVVVTLPTSGTLTLNANGGFTYVPNVTGTYTFTYRASDGALTSNLATVTLVLNGAPITVAESYAATEDTVLTVPAATGVLNNDHDPESQPLTATLVTQGTKGTVVLASNGGFTYTPLANANGADTFTYTASDGTRTSAVTTVTINIAPVNDAPVAVANSYTVPQNAAFTTTTTNGVLANDTDADGNALTATIVTSVTHGTLAFNLNGTFTYTPVLNYSGPDTFSYQASDGTLISAPVLVTLNVANAADDIVFNEVLARPGTAYPEATDLEWVEIYNRSTSTVDLSGWTISSGVSFTFPPGTSLASHAYLVIAANAAAFNAAHPTVTNYLGGWVGTLSDGTEKLTLTDALLINHDSCTYATQGDWGVRYKESEFNGWAWDPKTSGGDAANSPAIPGGYTMECRNPNLSNNNGQNWLTSAVVGGTPGLPNAALTTNIPPIIKNVAHYPAVPTSSDPVTISCELDDETPFSALRATLFWRNATTTSPPAFSTVVMSQDGQGKWFAPLAKQANNAIIEFYISATDGTLTRTWPAPVLDVTLSTLSQTANCQYQVSDEVPSANADMYRMIMTETENQAYAANAAVNSSTNKVDTVFNHTLVITRGNDSTIRYRCGVRVRGNSSRSYTFKPLRCTIPDDDPLEGHTTFNLNPKASFLQYFGMRCFEAGGVRATSAIPIELRRNGVEYTTSGGSTPDYGRWVRLEDLSGDMVSKHWPEASNGGLYKKGRPDRYWRNTLAAPSSPDVGYEQTGSGTNISPGWTKQNASGLNDWSDMLGFFQVMQTNLASHFPGTLATDTAQSTGGALSGNGVWNNTAFTTAEITNIETAADLDEWARWMAVMNLLQDYETNISNGQDDDYSMYFMPQTWLGVPRKRMQLVTHDMDTIFGLGDTPVAYNATNLFDATESGSVFRPLLPLMGTSTVAGNADFLNRYRTAMRELIGGIFNADTTASAYPPFYAFIDNHLTGWVPTATITAMKTFMTQRQTYLLNAPPLASNLGLINASAIAPTAATSISTFTAAHGALCIHEVLANNVSVYPNGTTFPDLIELCNTGATAISLTGKSISDDPLLKTKYVFPAAASIPAGSFLVLLADAVSAAPGTHLGFSLDQDGDAVYLYDTVAAGQTQLDSIVFGLQAPNLSIGRTGAGLTTWALCTPTVGAANTAVATLAAPSTLKINEWLGNAGSRFPDDFIELYNASANPVALGGMMLTDDAINYPTHGQIPPLSFMAGNSFVAFLAKGKNATPSNARELAYTLDISVGTIDLLGANGRVADRVELIAQFPDGSVGRTVDGGANWDRLATSSPGASNAALPTNIQNLLKYLRITELMYSPGASNQSEYIELRNVSDLAGTSVSLDLTGVYFSNGITYTFPTSTLAAGAHVVLVAESAKFTAQFPGVTIGGIYTGKLDNAGERVTLTLPTYGISILDFKYNNTWYPTTDGRGAALSIVDPLGTPDKWDLAVGWEATAPSPGATPAFSVYAGPDLSTPPNVPLYLDGSIIKGSFAANAITSGWSFISGPSTPTFTTANYQDANAIFTTSGVYVLQFSANNGTTTLTDTVNIYVTETYATWAARVIIGGNNASQQATLQDADHDGIVNLIEWATATNPLVVDEPLSIVPGTLSGNFMIRFNRSKLIPSEVQIIPQFSEDLTTWFDSSTNSVQVLKESETTTTETWTATSFLPGVPREFVRLTVVLP